MTLCCKGGRRFWMSVAAGLALAMLSHPAAWAVTELGPNGEEVRDSADDASKYLGNVYKDEVAGIKMAPPAGCRVINRAGMELVSFVQDEKQWGGDVLSVSLREKQTVDEYMRSSVAELSKTFRGVQVMESTELTFDKRKAGRLVTSMEADVSVPGADKSRKEKLALIRQQLIVQTAEDTFLVLTLYSPLKDRGEATRTFEAMMKSFEILDREAVAKQRFEAVKAGKEWLAQRTAEELKSKLNNQPQMFRIRIGGKDMGFIRFDEVEKDRDGTTGVMVAASSRAWLPDGSAVLGQNIAYWAYSHDEKSKQVRPGYSSWENTTKTVVKRADLPGGKFTFWVQEAGVMMEQPNTRLDEATLAQLRKEREELLKRKDLTPEQMPPTIEESQKQTHLIVSFSGDPTQGFTDKNKGTDVLIPEQRPAVMPKILEYVWPRLVDLHKRTEMMFVVYNSSSRKVTLRTFSVKGPDRVSIDGKWTECIKCADEMDNTGTTLWVDGTGKILKMLTSDQSVLEPTTEEKMQRLWGDKVKG